MKRLTLLLILCASAALYADEPRSIEVMGEGVVKAEPDQVTLQFGIESKDRDISKAKDDSARKTKSFLDALKKFNIASQDIQTGYVQISPTYNYINGKQVFDGYIASKQLSVKIKNLNDYGKILNAVIDAGVDHVSGLTFDNSKTDDLKMEARKRAVADAKTKADVLAAELHQKVGAPLFIQEGAAPSQPPVFRGAMMMRAMAKDAAVEDSVSPGENTIRATVTVRFQLQ